MSRPSSGGIRTSTLLTIAVTVRMRRQRWPGFSSYSDKLRRRLRQSGLRVAGVVGVPTTSGALGRALTNRPIPESPGTRSRRFSTNYRLSPEQLKVLVPPNGWITLEGGSRMGFSMVARRTSGAGGSKGSGVTNSIHTPRVQPGRSSANQEAFRRGAEIDAKRISVEAHEGDVNPQQAACVFSWARTSGFGTIAAGPLRESKGG